MSYALCLKVLAPNILKQLRHFLFPFASFLSFSIFDFSHNLSHSASKIVRLKAISRALFVHRKSISASLLSPPLLLPPLPLVTMAERNRCSHSTVNNNHALKNGVHSMDCSKNGYSLCELSPNDRAKRSAAFACGEAEIFKGMKIGVGSGTTVKFLIDWLRDRYHENKLPGICCVPTSFQTRLWLREANIPVADLDELNELDLAIDGADEIDAGLNCIKGGGGCLMQEKIVQTCAKRFVIIGGLDKYSETFGQAYRSIPIEVASAGLVPVQRWINERFGGECVLRMDARKCFPVITENHNYIIDWKFPTDKCDVDWDTLNREILCMPGVAETGLFINVAKLAYLATPDGEIHIVHAK